MAWLPMARRAMRAAPVVIEVARRLDRQLRPHVLAYRLAQEVDGYVGRWTGNEGRHWLVFTRPDTEPIRSFPPMSRQETEVAARELDRSTLRHHRDLPEAKFRAQTDAVITAPRRAAARLRRPAATDDPDLS